MKYVVTITQTTGKPLEELFFDDLKAARVYYQHVINSTLHERVLILLLEKPTPYEERIIDVDFKDGISYNIPKASNEGMSSER